MPFQQPQVLKHVFIFSYLLKVGGFGVLCIIIAGLGFPYYADLCVISNVSYLPSHSVCGVVTFFSSLK